MKFYLDNWRWQGVPFTFARAKECRKNNPLLSYSSSRYRIPPFLLKGRHDAKPLNHKHSASNGYQATVYDKKTRFVTFVETSGNGFDYFSCSTQSPEAYETLVLDALLGDPTLFMRSDQVEEAWDVVTTIQEAWENDKSLSLDKYEAGVGS
jgi:glucose-6-phosphate 1-dehydrogenase